MSQARPQDFDLDEDLFAFGAVESPAPAEAESEEDLEEIFASFRDAANQEELVAVPAIPSAAPQPRHTEPPPADAYADEPIAPPPRATVAATVPAHETSRALSPAARPARFSKSVIAVALSVTALNSVLAVVMLRGRRVESHETAAPPPVEEHAVEHDPARDARTEPALPDPDEVEALHSHPTLDEARAEIARGEFAAARQRVYGLLAIIDRLADPRRSALEADCQFLIAQSLHLEAIARMETER